MSRASRAVPVLMLHSVAFEEHLAPHGWLQRLSVAPDLLDATFSAWRRRGFRTIPFEDVVAYVRRGTKLPKGAIALTLDDGYVDNWIALHPLLSAHGLHATIFVSTDYVDPRPLQRPQLLPGVDPATLPWKGYLSWEEMRAMESDGTVRCESHARTHTWYFTSGRIVDYFRPEAAISQRASLLRFLWLNENEGRKWSMLESMSDASVPWGTPIYEHAPALVARRFFPDPRETEELTAFVGSQDPAAFFAAPGWRRHLDGLVERLRAEGRGAGRWETEEEREARVLGELTESRRVLSRGLGRDVRFLSCPQGAMSEDVERLARSAGYEAWTRSTFASGRLNRPGGPSAHVYRSGDGFGLFGAGASVGLRVLSNRLVLERYAGSRWAHLATSVVSRASTLLGRREPVAAAG